MSTFADFALLAAVPMYGGAEILRAQRILPMGPGPRVHLTILGRNDSITRRVVGAAHAGSAVLHPALSRIFEVCRFDGVAYAVSDPSEGLDLSALVGRTKRAVPYELSLAVVASLARIAVSLHDAGGPGSRGGPTGFASVIPGGLAAEAIFLEQTGAVRLRPVSSAGVDPDVPSAFRAPEEAISAAADVYSLGRLLMALLTGDVSGLTMPRLSSSSPMSELLQQMVQRRPERRPPLHETVMRLEQGLRERNINAADQAVRNALNGALKPFVVDPGLGFDAPPHIAHELRMRLPYVYAAIERLWPSMQPGFAPAPAVFAALPAPSSPGVAQLDDDDDDAPVFADEGPKKRKRARTAATLMIDANDLAAAVAAVDAAAPQAAADEEKRKRRGRPTVKTVLIPMGEMLKALPDNGATPVAPPPPPPQRTVLIEGGPFAPPPLGAPPMAAPIPDDDDAFSNNDPDAATHELSLDAASVFARRPDPEPQARDRPARPPTLAALAVFDNGDGDDGVFDRDDVFDDEAAQAPVAGSLYQRLQAAEDAALAERSSSSPAPPAPSRRQAATIDAAVDPRDLLRSVLDDDDLDDDDLSDDDGAIDASEEGDAGFLSRTPQRPVATVVGPAPMISEPGGETAPRPAMRSAATDAESSRPRPRPTSPPAPPPAFATTSKSPSRPAVEAPAIDAPPPFLSDAWSPAPAARKSDPQFDFDDAEDTAAPPPQLYAGKQAPFEQAPIDEPVVASAPPVEEEGDFAAAFAAAFAGDAPALAATFDDAAFNVVAPTAAAAAEPESLDDDDLEEIEEIEAIEDEPEPLDDDHHEDDRDEAPPMMVTRPPAPPPPVVARPSSSSSSPPLAARPPSSLPPPARVDNDVPDALDDGAAFVMVGERGATFAADDNPFDQSTRLFAAQAMQRALEEDEVGESFDGDLDDDIDAALDGALGDGAWAPSSSSSPFSPPPQVPAPVSSALRPTPSPPPSFVPPRASGAAPVSVPTFAMPSVPTLPSSPTPASSFASSSQLSSLPAPPPLQADDDDFSPRTEMVETGAWQSWAKQPEPAPSERATIDDRPRTAPRTKAVSPFAALAPSLAPQTMVSPSPLHSDPSSEASPTQLGSLPDEVAVDASVPRNITGLFTPPRPSSASSELVVEAPAGAGIALNGAPIGVVGDDGRFAVDVAGDARVVVRVTLAGHAPWSSVVTVKGRPRVRVKATLQVR